MGPVAHYKALATDAAVARVVAAMPEAVLASLLQALERRGETLREAIGRAACRADRFGDFRVLPVGETSSA